MNAYGTPAAAGTDDDRFTPDRRDWLRLLGGILLASGAVVLSIRKESEWSDWALLFVLLVPCAVLYALAFAGRRWPSLQGWQSAFFAFAVLLLPLVFLQFIEAIDGDTGSRLNIAWIFGVGAAVALVTALRTDAWWQMLIAGVYAGVAWLAFWAEVLDEPSGDTVRWLLILFAAILLLAALVLARNNRRVGSDLITVAGIAAVLAGGISLAGLAGAAAGGLSEVVTGDTPNPSQGWNVFLLVVSLLLVAYGARSFTRGPAYVGAVGLLVFIGVTGADIVSRLEGDEAGGVVGWPLILLLVGAALLIAGFLMPRSDGGVTTEPPRFGPGGGEPAAAPQTAGPAPGGVAPAPTAPATPPAQGGAGGGLLDQWRTPPTGGQQPPGS